MSSLLKEAIVDAKALRDSALKNAETSVIQKYSEEVKATLEKLLEQEELVDLGDEPAQKNVAKNIPLAATDDLAEQEGEIPAGMQETGQEVPVSIDLDALQEAVKALEAELNEDEEIELTEEDLEEIANEPTTDEAKEELEEVAVDPGVASAEETQAAAAQDEESGEGGEELEEELDADALVDAIMEKLTVDMGADLAGWAGRSSEDLKYQIEKEMAHRRSTDVEEEMKDLKKAQEELVFENKQLTEKLSKYEGVLGELQENLQDVNLSNARLLYTNRVLRNTSLNERQKNKIAEAISNAGSVTEARTIFETLQSTVEAAPKRQPQSLSEAIGNKRSSVIRATRQESTPSDPIADRMKRLAGIK